MGKNKFHQTMYQDLSRSLYMSHVSKRNFCIYINGRFESTWMVTLYYSTSMSKKQGEGLRELATWA